MSLTASRYGLLAVFIFSLLLSACSTSNSVVSANFLQKRKYNKGFHVSLKTPGAKHSAATSEVALQPAASISTTATVKPSTSWTKAPATAKRKLVSHPLADDQTLVISSRKREAARATSMAMLLPAKLDGTSAAALAATSRPTPPNGQAEGPSANIPALISAVTGVYAFMTALLFAIFAGASSPLMIASGLLAILAAAASIILGFVALQQIAAAPDKWFGRGSAVVGLTFAWIAVLMWLTTLAVLAASEFV